MRTVDLIRALAADAATPTQSFGTRAALDLAAGTAITAIIFFAAIGFRADIAQALETIRFDFKFVFVLSLAVPAIGLSLRLARPGAGLGLWGSALALAPALLALGVLAELAAVPAAAWGTRLVGSNSHVCLTVIPLLSLAPLAGLLLALRHGAPTRPRLAGGVAGLAAAAIAAFLYASNCTDDSPLFVATWYPIAIGLVAVVGSLVGPRVLKW
jgi:hypothetical protein